MRRAWSAVPFLLHVLHVVAATQAAPPAAFAGEGSRVSRPGRVVAWGSNEHGGATVPTSASSGVVAIAAGSYHSLALLDSGRVVAWGYNTYGQATVPTEATTGVLVIAAGGGHSLALLASGSVVAWGSNFYGQATVPSDATTGVVAIAAGTHHSLALLASGRVVAWGKGDFGQATVPSDATTDVVAIAAGGHHSLALLAGGRVVAWGGNTSGQATVPSLASSSVVAIAAGGHHSLALLDSGGVVAWGGNFYGQATVPSLALSSVVAIAAGGYHSLTSLASGRMFAWGYKVDGQTSVPSDASWVSVLAIAAGNTHSLALVADEPPRPPPPQLSSSPQQSSVPVIAGIVGGAGGALVLLSVGGLLLWRRRRRMLADRAPAVLAVVTRDDEEAPLAKKDALPTDAWNYSIMNTAADTGGGSSSGGGTAAAVVVMPRAPSGADGASNISSSVGGGAAAPAAAHDVTALLDARQLAHLHIPWANLQLRDAPIASGGFGAVYLGTWSGNRVAVKVLRGVAGASPAAAAELRREVLMMSRVRHPGIATVYGLAVEEGPAGRCGLVMQYYRRGTLQSVLGSLAWGDVGELQRLRMAQQLAGGLERLHAAKPYPLLHGDLKSSNVLLTDDGKGAVIADFGLARGVREVTGAVEGGFVEMGGGGGGGALTISISPPEVLLDPSAPRGPSVDVYALGVVLFEMMTGHQAFAGMPRHVVIAVVLGGQRPAVPPSMRPEVAAIIEACWAQSPAARPRVAEVVVRLAAVIATLSDMETQVTTATHVV